MLQGQKDCRAGHVAAASVRDMETARILSGGAGPTHAAESAPVRSQGEFGSGEKFINPPPQTGANFDSRVPARHREQRGDAGPRLQVEDRLGDDAWSAAEQFVQSTVCVVPDFCTPSSLIS